MTLITCEDCGRRISDRAKSCPQCGGPVLIRPPELPEVAEDNDYSAPLTEEEEAAWTNRRPIRKEDSVEPGQFLAIMLALVGLAAVIALIALTLNSNSRARRVSTDAASLSTGTPTATRTAVLGNADERAAQEAVATYDSITMRKKPERRTSIRKLSDPQLTWLVNTKALDSLPYILDWRTEALLEILRRPAGPPSSADTNVESSDSASEWAVDTIRDDAGRYQGVIVGVGAGPLRMPGYEEEVPNFIIRCRHGITEAYVIVDAPVQPNEDAEYQDPVSRVSDRVEGEQKFSHSNWSLSRDQKTLFAPKPIALARRLEHGDKWYFMFTNTYGGYWDIVFPTRGLSNVLPVVAHACHWK